MVKFDDDIAIDGMRTYAGSRDILCCLPRNSRDCSYVVTTLTFGTWTYNSDSDRINTRERPVR